MSSRPTPFQDYTIPPRKAGEEPVRGHRAYLHARWTWEKEQDPKMSLAVFARRAGMKWSQRSALKNVIDGEEPLGADRLEKFIVALELDDDEAQHLRHLVALDKAKTPEERARLTRVVKEDRMRHGLENNKFLRPKDAEPYLRSWVLVAVRELIGTDTFREDHDWIAGRFGLAITAAEVGESIEALLRSGRIVRDPEGRLQAPQPCERTMDKGAGEAALSYHRDMVRLGQAQLDEKKRPLDPGSTFMTRCRYVGCTIRLDPADRDALFEELADVQKSILARYDKASGTEIVQVNLHAFPLTAEVTKD